MIELGTSSGSENDKCNKRYKYTLDEPLQAVLEFNDLIRAQPEVSFQGL